MNVLITGGAGFVGKKLTEKLGKDNILTILDRNVKNLPEKSGVRYVDADLSASGEWQKLIPEQDVIINLAGATIFKRWSKKTKAAIYSSRIQTTRNLVDALKGKKPKKKITLISTSAAGYYGFHEDEKIDESWGPGNDFLATVARDWEKEAYRAEEYGVRVITCRFGIVLGKNGGALGIMLPIFRSFFGGKLGKGNQWFSWIHEQDLMDIFIFLVQNKKISGPVNCTSPGPVRNSELTKVIQDLLNRPSLVPFIPAFSLRLVLGEFGNLILKGQRAMPGKLLDSGYRFAYPEITGALKQIIL